MAVKVFVTRKCLLSRFQKPARMGAKKISQAQAWPSLSIFPRHDDKSLSSPATLPFNTTQLRVHGPHRPQTKQATTTKHKACSFPELAKDNPKEARAQQNKERIQHLEFNKNNNSSKINNLG